MSLKAIGKGGWWKLLFGTGLPVIVYTATGVVRAKDTGKILIVNGSAAVVLTLPPLQAGLIFLIINKADQNLTVAAPTVDTLITYNDQGADSVAFSTASQLIGAMLLVFCDGTNYYAVNVGTHTCTVAT